VVGLCDEALPGPWDPDDSGHASEDEHELEQLRLLYVSLTRAKKALVVSRPERIKPGQVAALGLARTRAGSHFWQDLRPCRFLADLDPALLPAARQGDQWPGIDLAALPE
jgi:ATP-dependent exoDNAse (exonuclease V) beta subunit